MTIDEQIATQEFYAVINSQGLAFTPIGQGKVFGNRQMAEHFNAVPGSRVARVRVQVIDEPAPASLPFPFHTPTAAPGTSDRSGPSASRA